MSANDESTSMVTVKVTHEDENETTDLENGGGGTSTATSNGNNNDSKNPLQALRQQSAKFHEQTLRPLLAKAGESWRHVTEYGATKSRQVGAATVQQTRSLGLGTQVAAAAAVAHTQHTLSQIGSVPLEKTNGEAQEGDVVVVKGAANDWWVTGWHAHMIQIVAVAGGLAALVTMVLLEGHLIDLASLGTLLLSPLVVWQKMQLNALGGMRAQQNALRASVNQLTVENGKLEAANTQLETQVDGYVSFVGAMVFLCVSFLQSV